jgi:hypothetical protein
VTARRKPKPAPQQALPLAIAEGIHIGLPDDLYFEAPALGSSDFAVLYHDPASWWYASRHNPHRRARARKSPALTFGAALHALILEGDAAFARRFTVEPDDGASHWIRTPAEERRVLCELGERAEQIFDPPTLTRLLKKHGLAHRVLRLAWTAYEAAKSGGLAYITEDEERRLRRMAHLVEQHPDLGPGLRTGLTEVAVFWRKRVGDVDVLVRAKFDKLQPGFAIDVKSMGNARDKSPEEATFDAIADEEYDLQAEHYREARAQIARFVAEKRVYAWDHTGAGQRVLAEELAVLKAVAAATRWRWMWLFYQCQNDNAGQERAPVIVPWWTWPEGELFDRARRVIDQALENYAARVASFGLDQPWSEIRAINQLPVDRLKRLSFKRSQSQ